MIKIKIFCFIGKMSATIDRSSWPHGPSRRGFLLCQNSKQTHKQGRSRTGNYQFIYPTLISWILLTFYLWLQQPKRTVTGTDADLRKLPLKEARAILRSVEYWLISLILKKKSSIRSWRFLNPIPIVFSNFSYNCSNTVRAP